MTDPAKVDATPPSEQEAQGQPADPAAAKVEPTLPGDLDAALALLGEGGFPNESLPVTFATPRESGPLLPPDDAPQGKVGGVDAKVAKQRVRVPLEPILAGATTAALNGLVLNKPEDGQLTVDAARSTGFPMAVEACLELYFPDLELDHPLVGLIASGAALGVMVATLKGANAPPEPKPKQHEAKPADVDEDPAHDADPEDAGGSTGSAYWDAILQQAGGGA